MYSVSIHCKYYFLSSLHYPILSKWAFFIISYVFFFSSSFILLLLFLLLPLPLPLPLLSLSLSFFLWGCLKQQKFISQLLWPSQHVGIAVLSLEALGDILFLIFSSFSAERLQAFLDLSMYHSDLCLCLYSAFSSSLCVSLCVSCHINIGFKAHPDHL